MNPDAIKVGLQVNVNDEDVTAAITKVQAVSDLTGKLSGMIADLSNIPIRINVTTVTDSGRASAREETPEEKAKCAAMALHNYCFNVRNGTCASTAMKPQICPFRAGSPSCILREPAGRWAMHLLSPITI